MNPTQRSLFDKALKVRKHSYAPYSKFHVGVSLISTNGNIYSGCNVENASYPMSTCAEINAVSTMVAGGDRTIREVLIIGGGNAICPPCGMCRQVIREFAEESTPIHLCSPDGQCETKTLGELLPFSFGPNDLT